MAQYIHSITSITAGLCLIALSACDGDSITESESQINQLRATYGSYNAVATANANGYTVWSPDPTVSGSTCASAPEGKMGYHLVNVPLRGPAGTPETGDAVIDPLKPEMLLFEKKADGTVSLVGVEWIVFKAAWEREKGVGAAAPTVLGQPLLYSEHTFTTGGPVVAHYELHVWLFKDNPRGMFDPWHPNVTC